MRTEDDVALVWVIGGENGNGCLEVGHAWKDFLIFYDGPVDGASCRCGCGVDLRNSKLLRSERKDFAVEKRKQKQPTTKTLNGKRVLGLALCHISNVHY